MEPVGTPLRIQHHILNYIIKCYYYAIIGRNIVERPAASVREGIVAGDAPELHLVVVAVEVAVVAVEVA
eukprot:11001615-Heterocapsa_arctica.AAC.1